MTIEIELHGVSKDGKFIVQIFQQKELLGTIHPTAKGVKIMSDHFTANPEPPMHISYQTMDTNALKALLKALGEKPK